MSCVDPPELDEIVLLAHLDGEADHRVESHLESCEHCRKRAAALASFTRSMTSRLYRHDCPDPHQLAEYHAGMLSVEQARATKSHVAACTHCSSELATLRSFVAETTPDLEVAFADRIQVLVGKLVRGPSPMGPELQPALAGVRGAGDGPLIFDVGKGRVSIEIHPDPDTPGRYELFGLLTGTDESDIQVAAASEDSVVATSQVDDVGNFAISNLADGQYDLVFRSPTLEILLRAIEIR